jgi:uncharacterized membrane protein YdbT with pleckstrin-like domain
MDYKALHLDNGENVLLVVRRHWIVFLANGIILSFLAVLPPIAFSLLVILLPKVSSINIPGNDFWLFSFIYSLWLLFLWISFFSQWTKYYLDAWYVTEKRIIIVEQCRLFVREVSNVRFDRIQDVSVSINGLIATFLDFGNIKVQTASEDSSDFTLNLVRHPGEVRRVIFARHNILPDSDLQSSLVSTKSNSQPLEPTES